MVILIDYTRQPGDTGNEYQIKAFADDKSAVTEGMTIQNMPPEWIIQPGSIIYTANGDVAFYTSDGVWNWVA